MLSLVKVLVSKRQAQGKKCEKRSVKQLNECGEEDKASSFDDVVVKGVWGIIATEDCAKERI